MRPEHFHSGNSFSLHSGFYTVFVSMRPEHFHSGNVAVLVMGALNRERFQ